MEGFKLGSAVKAIVVTTMIILVLFRCVCGANLTVGGASGWDVSSNLQDWSASTAFHVGDDLVFSYTPVNDVVEVNKQGYDTCMISKAIAAYDTGETVIHLTEPGTRYFVCGRLGHCQQGLKVKVQVLGQPNNGSDQGHLPPSTPPLSPSPPPSVSQSSSPLESLPPPPPQDEPEEEFCDHTSGAGDGLANVLDLNRGLVPLVILVILSFTRACLIFTFSHLLVFIC